MHIRVAGFTIQVAWDEPDLSGLRLAASPATVPFLVEAATPDVRLGVTARGSIDDPGGAPCVFDSGGPWRLYRDAAGFLFRFFSSALGPLPYKTARFTGDFSRGLVTLNCKAFSATSAVDPLEYPLDELLIISLLAQERGIEVHACGVVDGDAGYLFVGQSGAGKSTMARLWMDEQPSLILSDDRVVLRGETDGLWMYGTPWHGEAPLASAGRARLAGIFFLRQAPAQDLVAVGRAAAVARLLAASFPPFHDARAIDFSLGFLDEVAQRVPCWELRFAPTPEIIQLVRTANGRS